MPVTDVRKDSEARTLTITTELDGDVERAWQLWADPRLLERWWGPPTYPATFSEHDLSPGGWCAYAMTGPEGDRSAGWWRVVESDPPRRLVFDDGFAGDDGQPNPDMPVMRMQVTIEARGGGSVMVVETTFPSAEAMDQMITMGMDEGMQAAMGQIDEVLVRA